MSGYEYTGYESAFVPTPMETPPSPEVDKKTDKPSKNPTGDSKSTQLTQKYLKPTESNVLNNYRSITYNFTLAALPSDYVSNPEAYRTAELGLVILKSGGKSYTGITPPTKASAAQRKQVEIEVYDKFDAKAKADVDKKNISQLESNNQILVQEFNAKSPGRFDMYIEDVEIETLMSFNEQSNTTIPTKIKFDVIEPYSVNGFIEALHVSSVAAGYTSYINASFVLKLEFWGIPDNDNKEFKRPEKIPNSERYFPIGFTNLEVEVTERGTKYQCSAVPYNERAFGQPSLIKKPIKMEGESVQDILTNFMKSFNEQVVQSAKDSKRDSSNVDVYEIKFVEWNTTEGWVAKTNSIIGKSKIQELFEDNVLYGFAKPNEGNNAYKTGTEPKSIKYNPKSAAINFPENKSVHEVISAVIKDSTYVRDILKDLAQEDKARSRIDPLGMVDYFNIKVEVENRDVYDTTTKKPFQKFTFVVSPHKVHFTRIPRYGQVQIKEEEFAKLSLREYNYLYMGKNIDVLNFKLNFNTLYFEAIPAAMADQNTPNYRDAAKPDNRNQPKVDAPSKDTQICNNPAHPMPPVREVVTTAQQNSSSAVPVQNDPYSTLARSMHDAIINSKASMLTGEIEILGDPFYLVTGGMGSYNPKPVQGSKNGVVGLKEVSPHYGEVNITINFRNPVDIGTFESGGLMEFDPNRVPFSGVYMITKATSIFKDAVFKQRLEIIRKPGQILGDHNCPEVRPENLTKNVQNDLNRSVSVPEEKVEPPSQRMTEAEVTEYLERSAPNPDINFSNASGGLGGTNVSAASTFGLVSQDGRLQSAAGVIGQSLPNDPTSNIKINLNQLSKLDNSALNPSALINAAANVITGNKTLQGAAGVIAGNVIGQTLNSLLKKSNLGSGIGEGASVLINPVSSVIGDPTANEVKAGAITDPVALAKDLVGTAATSVKNISQAALNQVERLGSDAAASLVGGIGAKVSQSLGSVADPKSIAAKVGLDASRLSGLSNNLQSKLPNQISSVVDKLPTDVNLSQALDQGLALDVIPPSKFKNLPPLTPFRTAPPPDIDPGVVAAAVALPAMAKVSNFVDMNAAKDKINSARAQLSSLSGTKQILDQNVSGSVGAAFGSKNLSNPLEKLINKSNSNNMLE